MAEVFDRAAISLEVNDQGEKGWRCLSCYRAGQPSYFSEFDGQEEAEAFAAEHQRTVHAPKPAPPGSGKPAEAPGPDAEPPTPAA
jgi:hypothetical protein